MSKFNSLLSNSLNSFMEDEDTKPLVFTREERRKLLDMSTKIETDFMSGKYRPYSPKDHGHHCDSVHMGPADTWVPAPAHTKIHQGVADVLRKMNMPTLGFAGDTTTRKFGNTFFESDGKTFDYFNFDQLPKISLKSIFPGTEEKKYKKPNTVEAPEIDYMTLYASSKKLRRTSEAIQPIPLYLDIGQKTDFDFSNFHLKKEKSLSEKLADIEKNMNFGTKDFNIEVETPSYMNLGMNKLRKFNSRGEEDETPSYSKMPQIDFSKVQKTKDEHTIPIYTIPQADLDRILRRKKEKTAPELISYSIEKFPWLKNIETPVYRANQDNWLGGRNSLDTSKAWSIDVTAHYSPVLKPLFTLEDNYISSFNHGNDAFNDTIKRVEMQRLNFECNNVGIADFENNIYKRDMIPVGKLSTGVTGKSIPFMPSDTSGLTIQYRSYR